MSGTAIIQGQATTFEAGKNMQVGTVPSIILDNPKYGRNVSQIVRLASGYDFKQVWYTGERVSVTDPTKNLDGFSGKRGKKGAGKARLPREERMKGYNKVEIRQHDRPFDFFNKGVVPIAIELRKGAQMLHHFEHPENAVYVFGPEDGSVNSELLRKCHHLLVIPVEHCLNLATAVSTVLWDRQRQMIEKGIVKDRTLDELLKGDRASLRNANDEDMVYDRKKK